MRPRRPRKNPNDPRVGREIRSEQVRVIDPEGEQLGVMPIVKALQLAESFNLDLVEVAAKANPPVCRITDYSHFRYEKQRKERQGRKAKPKPVHQLRMRPQIGEHDYQVKKRQALSFVTRGEKVRLTVQLRGRMNSHPELGHKLLDRLIEDLREAALPEAPPRREGTQIHVLLAPR